MYQRQPPGFSLSQLADVTYDRLIFNILHEVNANDIDIPVREHPQRYYLRCRQHSIVNGLSKLHSSLQRTNRIDFPSQAHAHHKSAYEMRTSHSHIPVTTYHHYPYRQSITSVRTLETVSQRLHYIRRDLSNLVLGNRIVTIKCPEQQFASFLHLIQTVYTGLLSLPIHRAFPQPHDASESYPSANTFFRMASSSISSSACTSLSNTSASFSAS